MPERGGNGGGDWTLMEGMGAAAGMQGTEVLTKWGGVAMPGVCVASVVESGVCVAKVVGVMSKADEAVPVLGSRALVLVDENDDGDDEVVLEEEGMVEGVAGGGDDNGDSTDFMGERSGRKRGRLSAGVSGAAESAVAAGKVGVVSDDGAGVREGPVTAVLVLMVGVKIRLWPVALASSGGAGWALSRTPEDGGSPSMPHP